MFRIDLRRKIESFSFFIERNLLILLNILRIILFSIELFSAIFRKTNLSKNARLSMESIQIVFWSSRRKFLRFYPPGRNDTLQFREMYLLNAIRFAFKQFQIMQFRRNSITHKLEQFYQIQFTLTADIQHPVINPNVEKCFVPGGKPLSYFG